MLFKDFHKNLYVCMYVCKNEYKRTLGEILVCATGVDTSFTGDELSAAVSMDKVETVVGVLLSICEIDNYYYEHVRKKIP